MPQKWYQKVSVQTAIISGIFLLAASIIAGLFNLYSGCEKTPPIKINHQDSTLSKSDSVKSPAISNKPTISQLEIRGQVFNKKDREPIPQAEVSVIGRTVYDYTDDNGFFSITLKKVSQTKLKIIVKAAQFRPKEIEIIADSKEKNLEIFLDSN